MRRGLRSLRSLGRSSLRRGRGRNHWGGRSDRRHRGDRRGRRFRGGGLRRAGRFRSRGRRGGRGLSGLRSSSSGGGRSSSGADRGVSFGASTFFTRLLLSGLTGLMLTRQFDGALAGPLLFSRQVRVVARGTLRGAWRGGRRREGALLGRRRRGEIARRRIVRPLAFGLHDHGLGAAVAEALLHRARADRSSPTGLEGQGSSPARGPAVVVLVAHALALLTGRDGPDHGHFNSSRRAKPT